VAEPIPTFLCIDVEPEARAIPTGERPPWHGFDVLAEHLDALRPRLADRAGRAVTYGWFARVDPQIETCYGDAAYAFRRHADRFSELRAHGDVLGVHPHSFRIDPHTGRWRSDYADEDWIEHCQEVAFAGFRDATGEQCRLHRFGDHLLTSRIVATAERLGATIDLTAEPGLRGARRLARHEPTYGSLPDCRPVPQVPYRASAGDWRRPDPTRTSGMWIVPLTSADPRPAEVWRRRALRRLTLHGRPRHRPLLPHRPWRDAHAYWDLVARTLDAMAQPYLAIALRTDRPDDPVATRVRESLHALVDHPLSTRLAFVDPERAVGIFTASTAR
jgi:hypothetical protein